MRFGLYYQAEVDPKRTWFFVATLRSFEHMIFDRTLDKVTHTFEFFVPQGMQTVFEQLLEYYKKEGIVSSVRQLPNRLAQ